AATPHLLEAATVPGTSECCRCRRPTTLRAAGRWPAEFGRPTDGAGARCRSRRRRPREAPEPLRWGRHVGNREWAPRQGTGGWVLPQAPGWGDPGVARPPRLIGPRRPRWAPPREARPPDRSRDGRGRPRERSVR